MINATKARSVYLKKARKIIAKAIQESVQRGKAFVTISFNEASFKSAPIITPWLESMGYAVKLNEDGLTMLVSWV